ncbi:hypothetical protein KGQ20_02145 [Catenulispora sp. NF23]|uniref:Uncharacterized protein n=1 Tax=Catenulispora pinistramenti TaxID=2705254 RepID=A0ABS5KKD8_9ACTN|nr:hypothetical protein [Catenulispora pinistramenti]MBS2531566.1 hypothetical protein [Catenulispora pinistramenti]MBS2546184.1 hypothetical protein [Catenulispora pinistramenti]
MSPQDSGREFVSVPVPAEHVMDVYAFLARLGADQTKVSANAARRYDAWTVEELARLAATDLPSIKTIAEVMNHLAAAPGKKYPMAGLVSMVAVERNQLQGRLSALSRHLNAHYEGIGWPFDWSEDSNGEFHYWMDDEIAAKWKQARA